MPTKNTPYAKQRAALEKKIIAATYPKIPKNPKARKISEYIEAVDFGCYAEKVAGLASLITGLDIKLTSTSHSFMAIVPTERRNYHDYPLGKVCVCKYDEIFYDEDWETGNFMDKNCNTWRLATRAEIKKYVSNLPAEAFK